MKRGIEIPRSSLEESKGGPERTALSLVNPEDILVKIPSAHNQESPPDEFEVERVL